MALCKLPDLMSVAEMRLFVDGRISKVNIPKDFYCVTSVPAPLAGMPAPEYHMDWEGLVSAGFKHIVNLTSDH